VYPGPLYSETIPEDARVFARPEKGGASMEKGKDKREMSRHGFLKLGLASISAALLLVAAGCVGEDDDEGDEDDDDDDEGRRRRRRRR
jgi:hypothetical protein